MIMFSKDTRDFTRAGTNKIKQVESYQPTKIIANNKEVTTIHYKFLLTIVDVHQKYC